MREVSNTHCERCKVLAQTFRRACLKRSADMRRKSDESPKIKIEVIGAQTENMVRESKETQGDQVEWGSKDSRTRLRDLSKAYA